VAAEKLRDNSNLAGFRWMSKCGYRYLFTRLFKPQLNTEG